MELDNDVCKELAKCIETLTHSGSKSLDNELLKKVKNICKISAEYLEQTYNLIFYELRKNHAEVRYSAFQICDYIFRRSEVFRELVESNMQLLMELTAETNLDRPLPPPKSAAKNLKRLALETIIEWNREFGDDHIKLRLGYNYLKQCKKVDLRAIEIQNAAERARLKAEQEREKYLKEQKIKKVHNEMKELQPEIENSRTALENCVSLLLPPPDSFFVQDEDESPDEDVAHTSSKSSNILPADDADTESDSENLESNNALRQCGIFNSQYNIQVNVKLDKPVVKITADNSDIADNARDNFNLLKNRYLPSVKKWIETLTKVSGDSDELKSLTDLKQSIETSLVKFLQLNLQAAVDNDSDSSHSDFEEVEDKEGYESVVKEYIHPAKSRASTVKKSTSTDAVTSWSIFSQENSAEDPTTLQSTVSSLNMKTPEDSSKNTDKIDSNKSVTSDKLDDAQPSTSKATAAPDSRKAKLLSVAPKLPFDVDLYHWEDEKLTAPTLLSVKAEGARFWSAVSTDDLEEIPVPEGAASLRTRVIEFSGQFKPVKWSCRAPLPNGKLCPRKDRYKCPFHGPVVPRDETGKRTDVPEEEQANPSVNEEKVEENEYPDWQDPKLLEEIKQATGVDLKMPEKKKKKDKSKTTPKAKRKTFKEKYPGLTDIKAKESTSYTRLSKKIFKKSSMKRVARALDNLDHKRFRDKYGDQFNYVHGSS